jgi:hypothetical protein
MPRILLVAILLAGAVQVALAIGWLLERGAGH